MKINFIMNRLLLLLLLIPVCVSAQRFKEQLTFTATGDQVMPMGRYQIGGSIRIECHISGGWAEDGGIYHVVSDWDTKPKVIYRGESSISTRLKFFGYVDSIHPGQAFLFATWDNQSPEEGHVNVVKFTIYSESSIDLTRQGSFVNATQLESVLVVQSLTGNVGIGTSAPLGKLHLAGGNANGAIPSFIVGGGVSSENINDLYILDSKNNNNGVGFGARVIGVNIQGQTDGSNRILQRTAWGGVTGASAIYLGTDDVYQGQFGILTSPQGSAAGMILTERFTVKGNGNVGIGTVSPDSKLTVKGIIHAEEVKVDLNVPGPDYVFEENYPLASLETKAYIDRHKHLPGIPSSAEMQQNGVHLLEMNMKLLQKVEELTLHIIRQNEEIKLLKEHNIKILEQEIRKLKDSPE